jgi:uncharacterized repeat protein (TIGR01451 family)
MRRVLSAGVLVLILLISGTVVFFLGTTAETSSEVAEDNVQGPQSGFSVMAATDEDSQKDLPGMQRIRFQQADNGHRGQNYDIGIDTGTTYYLSSGIPEWGWASLGEVNKTVEFHVRVRNKGAVSVSNINVTLTVYMWLDVGALNGGPIIFRENRITFVAGGDGSLSDEMVFYWTPEKAQCHIINISVDSPNDPYLVDNEGWWYGDQYPPQPSTPRFLSGLYTDSWSNDASTAAGFIGDLGAVNAWHPVSNIPVATSGSHSGTDAWWCGNDSLGHCGQLWSNMSLVSEPISLEDYDPYAKNPEDPASSSFEPQIYFDYKWTGNVTASTGGGLFTYISTNGGLSWEPIVVDDFDQKRPAIGSTWNSSSGNFRWTYWVHTTDKQYKRYGIPIGKYVGEVVRFKLEYVPGNVSKYNDTGFYIDDLIVWGRQKMPFTGFELEHPSNMSVVMDWDEEVTLNFTMKNIEDKPQNIRVNMRESVTHWEESVNVIINESLFELPARPGYSNVSITLVPSVMAPAGDYSINITFTGTITKTVRIYVKIREYLNLSISTDVSSITSKGGESSLFTFHVKNEANIPKIVNLSAAGSSNGWGDFYLNEDDEEPVNNISFFNKENLSLFFRVDIPENAPPTNYTYTLDASLNGTTISDSIELKVSVKQYYDLALLLGNDVQEILPDDPLENRTKVFTFKVSNKGNGNDTFEIKTTPLLEEDEELKIAVSIENNTIGVGSENKVRDITWTVTIPPNASYGNHSFTINVKSDNGDIDYSDNQDIITIDVKEPVILEIYNFTFLDDISMDPPQPALGMEVDFSVPFKNTGTTKVDLEFTINITGLSNETIPTFSGLEPSLEDSLEFSKVFSYPRNYSLSIKCVLKSFSTGEVKIERVITKDFYVGYIDLAVESMNILRGPVLLDPETDELNHGETLTLSINVSNLGDIPASDVQLIITLDDGNTTLKREIPQFELEGGGFEIIDDPFQVSENATELHIRILISREMDYLDYNISNNNLEEDFTLSKEEENGETYLGTLLIIIAIIFFMMLVFIIFLFYTKRAEADREEEHIRIDEDELDELLDDSDLKVSFIDDDEDDDEGYGVSSSGRQTSRSVDDDEEEVVEAVMGKPMIVEGEIGIDDEYVNLDEE